MSEKPQQSPIDPLNISDPMQRKFMLLEQRVEELEERLADHSATPKMKLNGLLDGEWVVGQITAAGADANHWKWQFVVTSHTDGSDVLGQQGESIYGECTVIGANDGIVGMQGIMVIQGRDDTTMSAAMVVGGGGGTVGFHITGDATGQCIYTGDSYTDPTTLATGASDLSASDFGTANTGDSIILNMAELGFSLTGHDVTNSNNTFSTYGNGRLLGINSDGKKVITTQLYYSTCKPAGS